MFDREEEEDYLAIADRRIHNLEEEIQLLLVQMDSLRAQGTDTDTVLALLATADKVLITLKTFRSQVLERLKHG